MRIAFLGLGIMGSRMAANLLAAGHELTVWNRTARHRRRLGGRASRRVRRGDARRGRRGRASS